MTGTDDATPSMIGAILFDKDGTLFDFNATWGAWAQGLLDELSAGDAGLRATMARTLGFDLAHARFMPGSCVIAGTLAEVVALLFPLLPEAVALRLPTPQELTRHLDARAAEAPQTPAADLGQVLGALRARGLRLGVATNDTESTARLQLQREGVSDLFDFIAGADSGHGAKPEPGQLLAFAAQTGIAPGRIAMVGDSLHDLGAGRAAGMVAIGVLSGPARRETLAPMADVVLDTIADLPAWVDAL